MKNLGVSSTSLLTDRITTAIIPESTLVVSCSLLMVFYVAVVVDAACMRCDAVLSGEGKRVMKKVRAALMPAQVFYCRRGFIAGPGSEEAKWGSPLCWFAQRLFTHVYFALRSQLSAPNYRCWAQLAPADSGVCNHSAPVLCME